MEEDEASEGNHRPVEHHRGEVRRTGVGETVDDPVGCGSGGWRWTRGASWEACGWD